MKVQKMIVLDKDEMEVISKAFNIIDEICDVDSRKCVTDIFSYLYDRCNIDEDGKLMLNYNIVYVEDI